MDFKGKKDQKEKREMQKIGVITKAKKSNEIGHLDWDHMFGRPSQAEMSVSGLQEEEGGLSKRVTSIQKSNQHHGLGILWLLILRGKGHELNLFLYYIIF